MKTLSVRLPHPLFAEIEAESRMRRVSKSDVVRERLSHPAHGPRELSGLDAIADLVGAVDGLPADLSSNTKRYLKAASDNRKRPR